MFHLLWCLCFNVPLHTMSKGQGGQCLAAVHCLCKRGGQVVGGVVVGCVVATATQKPKLWWVLLVLKVWLAQVGWQTVWFKAMEALMAQHKHHHLTTNNTTR